MFKNILSRSIAVTVFVAVSIALTSCNSTAPTPTEVAAIAPTATPPPIPMTPVPTSTRVESANTPIPAPTIGDIEVSPDLPAVEPGKPIGLYINVSGGVNPSDLNFQWKVPSGQGEITEGQGTSGITYKAPNAPGLYKIEVEIKGDKMAFPGEPFTDIIFITVMQPTEMPSTEEKATDGPTVEPITVTPAPDGPLAVFTSPSADGAQVPPQSLCTGTITNMPPDRQLWLIVYPYDNLKYHPQNGPAAISSQGDWRNACYVGGPSPSYAGLKVDILAVLVDEAGAQAFKDYLNNASTMNPPWDGMPSLPADAQIVGQITGIVRQ